MEIRTLVTRSTPWAAAFLQVSSYSVRAESNWNMRIMFHPFSYQRWSIFDLNDKLSRRSLHSWIADCVKKKLAPTKKFCLQIQIICCSIIIWKFEDSQFTQNNHNQSLTCWPEILDTSSGRSNSWKIWKFTYIPLKCIPLKCIPLKCMPLKCILLKCMYLKCMSLISTSLGQSTKLSSVWIFPFHNVAKSLSQICYVPTVARGGARKKGVPEGFSFISVR